MFSAARNCFSLLCIIVYVCVTNVDRIFVNINSIVCIKLLISTVDCLKPILLITLDKFYKVLSIIGIIAIIYALYVPMRHCCPYLYPNIV